MNKVQRYISVNAFFSTFCAIVLLALSNQLAFYFGVASATIFRVIGILLLVFSFTLVYEVVKQRPLAVLWIIVQDFLWVIGSIILLITDPFDVSKTGNTVIAIVAIIVLLMGLGQAKALAQIDDTPVKGKKQLRYERTVKASKQEVWKVISDVANYDKVAPNIDDVKIISGEGRGMIRSCSHGKDSWTETCSMWVEEKSYSFIVNTTAPDYPYKFLTYLQGTWEVQEMGSHITKIVMHFDIKYKHRYHHLFFHPLLKGMFRGTINGLLDNWQKILEGK